MGTRNFFSLAFTLFEQRCSDFCQVAGKICRIHTHRRTRTHSRKEQWPRVSESDCNLAFN